MTEILLEREKAYKMAGAEHPNLEIIKFVVTLGDGTVDEVQVKNNDDIHVKIPADTDFQNTIHFKVKGTKLTKLMYKQQMKKFGVTVKTKENYMGDEFEPLEDEYVVAFPTDHSPLGMLSKGEFACISTYYADEVVLFEAPWRLTII